jgi:hypothetical protein
MTRPIERAAVVVLPLLLASSCVIGGDRYPRPRDLSPSWLVDRTRVLAVVAEPPEIRPGMTSRFSALIASPTDEELLKVWFACPVDDEGNGFGCFADLGSLDLENATAEDLFELGVVGFEPGLPPSYTAPGDFLESVPPEDRPEGRYVNVQVSALPESVTSGVDPDATEVPEVDFNEVEVAYKRLVVSEAPTPNHNPTIDTFMVDRIAVDADTVVVVEAEQSYDLGIRLPDGTREVYEFITSDGVVEERVEEPYASWYSTGGEVLEEVTLHPYLESTWTAPDGPEEGTWYVVLRDRRGGMVWHVQRWAVR